MGVSGVLYYGKISGLFVDTVYMLLNNGPYRYITDNKTFFNKNLNIELEAMKQDGITCDIYTL